MGIIDLDNRVELTNNIPQIFQSTELNFFTASLIGTNTLISVKHGIINKFQQFVFNNGSIELNASAVFVHPTKDIALFKFRESTNIKPFTLSKPSKTTLDIETNITGYSYTLPYQYKSIEGRLNHIQNNNSIQYTLDTTPGTSGSPVLNLNNEIVAIHRAYVPAFNYNFGTAVDQELIDIVNSIEDIGHFHPSESEEDLSEIVRFLNTKNYSHLYTVDPIAVADLELHPDFIREDTGIKNTEDPVWEFYNHNTETFFYTDNWNEIEYIRQNLEHFEENGMTFGVEDNTVHRLYNPLNGRHLYTTDIIEIAYAEQNLGFTKEGFL